MEKRKKSESKVSPLPVDYLKMVSDVFASHFDSELKAFNQLKPDTTFEALGEIYSDEIILAVSLNTEGQLSATTVYASCDFDPQASFPTAQDLLAACVDAVGSIFSSLLNSNQPESLTQLSQEPLSALENVPFQWTEIECNNSRIYLKVDKANLKVEALAEEWLRENDPEFLKNEQEEYKKSENLFITGPRKSDTTGNNSGSIH